METWEYQSLLCTGSDMEMALAALGRQGWEAIGFAPTVHQKSDTVPFASTTVVSEWTAQQYRVLLKRRKP